MKLKEMHLKVANVLLLNLNNVYVTKEGGSIKERTSLNNLDS